MSGSQTHPHPSEPIRLAATRREVADSEYRTAYLPSFMVRLPAGLHERLCQRARQEHKSLGDLLIETLEEAVHKCGGQGLLRAGRDR